MYLEEEENIGISYDKELGTDDSKANISFMFGNDKERRDDEDVTKHELILSGTNTIERMILMSLVTRE